MSKDFGKNNSNIITDVRIKVNGVYATQPIALYNYFAYGMPKTDANDYTENISLTTNIKYGFNNQLVVSMFSKGFAFKKIKAKGFQEHITFEGRASYLCKELNNCKLTELK